MTVRGRDQSLVGALRRFLAMGAVGPLFVLAACATTPPAEPVALPAVLDPLFVNCAGGDGAAVVRVYENEAMLGQTELEWLAESGTKWQIEVLNPIGQTLVKLASAGSDLTVGGQMSARIPPLAVREDGFLEVDGHLVALKQSEIPCLLSFQLPRSWLQGLAEARVKGKQARLTYIDEVREIAIRVRGLKQKDGAARVCSKIKWSQFLGLVRSELKWCQGMTDRKLKATLTGLGDQSLEWEKIDD